jgi:hypothetical protein
MKNIAVSSLPDPVHHLPVKAGFVTDLAGTIKRHVKEKHSKECAEQHDDAFKKFHKVRQDSVDVCNTHLSATIAAPSNSLSESIIHSNLYHYSVLLQFANRHFPLSDGKVYGVQYNWKDAFTGKSTRTTVNSFTDLSSVLYNAAALWSIMAAREPKDSQQGLKNAFQLYQQAAGVLEAIHVKLIPNYAAGTSVDDQTQIAFEIGKDGLEVCMAILLTYANHCGYLKAVATSKHGLLSKLALEVSNSYAAVGRSMRQQGTDIVSDAYTNIMDYWEKVFLARSHWHLAAEVGAADVDIATCIARLRIVHSTLEGASRVANSNLKAHIQDMMRSAGQQLEACERLNSTVYTERIPKTVPDPVGTGGKSLAKCTPLTPLMEATGISVDPFSDIVPVHIATAANVYKEQLAEKVKTHIRGIHAHREKIRNNIHKMGAMGLIEALDAASRKDEQLPAPLEQRIKRVHAEGGSNALKGLLDSVGSIKQLAELCKGIIDGCVNSIAACPPRAIGETDMELETTYTTATQLQVDVQELLGRLGKQDAKIKRNEEGLRKVSWSLKDIAVLMPSKGTDLSSNGESEAQQQLLVQMRTAIGDLGLQEEVELNSLNELQSMLEQEDITNKLASLPHDRHQSVLEQAVKRYGEILLLLNENAQKSTTTYNTVARIVTEINNMQAANVVSCQRASWVNELDNACSLYFDIRGALRELSQVASQQSGQTERLKETIDTIVFIRKSETEERDRQEREAEDRRRAELDRRNRMDKEHADCKQRQDDLRVQLAKATQEMERGAEDRKRIVENGLRQQQDMMRRVQQQQAAAAAAQAAQYQQQQQQQMRVEQSSFQPIAMPSFYNQPPSAYAPPPSYAPPPYSSL